MKKTLFLLALLMCGDVLQAQEKKSSIVVDGNGMPDERASTRVLYWDSAKDSAAGEFAIDYGRPAWKKEYDDPAKFDAMTKGKVWRMGNNFWTVLDTNLLLKFPDKDVPIGSYYLGIHRSSDGNQWSLAFIDPVKVRAVQLDGFQIEKAPIQFKVPLTFEAASLPADKLTVTFRNSKDMPRDVTMKVAWGKMTLTVPIEVDLSQ